VFFAIAGTLGAMIYTSYVYGAEPIRATSSDAAMAIDDGKFVDINGVQQWITIRGRDLSNPVLVLLHGGPGMALSGMAPIFSEWEKYYTVVQWDQPNSGATHIQNMQTGQGVLTIERYVRDGIAVVNYIRAQLKQDKVILMGASWGTILGVEMIKRSPELFSAYVGTAQVVSAKEGGKLGYDLALQAARTRGDLKAVQALEQVGPPPFKNFEHFMVRQQYSNPPAMPASAAEQAATFAVMKLMSAPPPADARYNAFKMLPPGFDPGMMFMNALRAVFVECWQWEARDLGMKFNVPVFIFQGEADVNTPTSLAREYLEDLQAPKKAFVAIAGAGHNTIVFHAELLRLLNHQVLPVVGPGL
jgi:pimeloyl-ACP methyl ester carboxylesterase